MDAENLNRAYREARERDDALIPDKKCPHGSRLRVCVYPACLATRARLLRAATEAGRRDGR